jgi:hypothetical protein
VDYSCGLHCAATFLKPDTNTYSGQGSIPIWDRVFLFTTVLRVAVDLSQPPVSVYQGILYSGVMHEADYSPPAGTD